MKPFIRNLLRMSVYQIKYMDAVPDSAVCNEAVKLAKRHKFAQLSGFVNGVLRNIARNIDSVQFDHSKSTISIRTNLTRCTPDELRAMLEAEGVTVTAVDELNYAFVISGFDYLNGLQSFRDGLFYVQDISSMLVAQTAAPKKGDYVIDVCAAPGGKSTHIAELLQGSGHVLARDLTDNKVDMIEENIDRHGLNNMSAEVWDATVFDADSAGKADILICDLPCSGLGVLGRKKDIRYKMTPESVDELAALQRQILDTVHTYVKPNGVLVYSTCTIDEAENEDNVRWFIEKHPEFELDKNFAEGTGMKQILPGEHGSDGFFIARFIKSKL